MLCINSCYGTSLKAWLLRNPVWDGGTFERLPKLTRKALKYILQRNNIENCRLWSNCCLHQKPTFLYHLFWIITWGFITYSWKCDCQKATTHFYTFFSSFYCLGKDLHSKTKQDNWESKNCKTRTRIMTIYKWQRRNQRRATNCAEKGPNHPLQERRNWRASHETPSHFLSVPSRPRAQIGRFQRPLDARLVSQPWCWHWSLGRAASSGLASFQKVPPVPRLVALAIVFVPDDATSKLVPSRVQN